MGSLLLRGRKYVLEQARLLYVKEFYAHVEMYAGGLSDRRMVPGAVYQSGCVGLGISFGHFERAGFFPF
jgi:hypothetical protein